MKAMILIIFIIYRYVYIEYFSTWNQAKYHTEIEETAFNPYFISFLTCWATFYALRSIRGSSPIRVYISIKKLLMNSSLYSSSPEFEIWLLWSNLSISNYLYKSMILIFNFLAYSLLSPYLLSSSFFFIFNT